MAKEDGTQLLVGSGYSDVSDESAAVADAMAAALADAGSAPRLILAFASPRYDVKAVTEALRHQAPAGAPIVGGTTNGQLDSSFTTRPDVDVDAGVVVIAMGGPIEVAVHALPAVSLDRRQAGADSAARMAELTKPYRLLLLLADGLTREQHEIVWGAYSEIGAVIPIAGGCCGDNLQYDQTYQFHGDCESIEVGSDTLIAVALATDKPIGVGVAHGWSKTGESMMVTSSEGGRLLELDDLPAMGVYLEHLGLDASAVEDRERLLETLFARPLGLSRRKGEDIRVIHNVSVEDGAIECLADVPQGAIVWPMTADEDSIIDAGGSSVQQALDGLEGHRPAGLLVFDCAARKIMLQPSGVTRELCRIRDVAGEVPFAGMYTYGEIARMNSTRGMHHLSVVSIAFAR